ncbi:MAG: hypothetical protein HY694_11430 [Deltaproteobacteria bacterium]|nr:hypothetical protein [Deltaproteobacteria bacterium]
MIPCQPPAEFMVEALTPRLGVGNAQLSDYFAWRQDILSLAIDLRRLPSITEENGCQWKLFSSKAASWALRPGLGELLYLKDLPPVNH